jgi:hypothetical protein
LQVVSGIIEKGYQSLERAVSALDAGNSSAGSDASLSETYLAQYKYCDRYLRLAEEPG